MFPRDTTQLLTIYNFIASGKGNGKAPRIDQIVAELSKADTEKTCVALRHLFYLIWREEKMPK